MRLCGLRLPSRDSTRVYAVTDARNNTSDDELLEVVGGRHNYGSDGHDSASSHDRSPSAKRITDENADNRSKEASQIVGCDSNPLVRLAL